MLLGMARSFEITANGAVDAVFSFKVETEIR
jgi:hypothetical protein